MKTYIVALGFVGDEMIIANSALSALLAIYHLISKVCWWNNFKKEVYYGTELDAYAFILCIAQVKADKVK